MDTITFRRDEQVDKALAELTADGSSRSAAIRAALLVAARERRRERLRAEAAMAMADPDDRAEAQRILADMEPLRAW